MDTIYTRFGMMEEQLRAITQQLANLGTRRGPTNPSKEEKSNGRHVKPFYWQIRHGDHHRLTRQEDGEDDLNVKIEILEYHSILWGDDLD